MNRDKHRHHALCKASAKCLLNAGHIEQDQHDEIVARADKGMKAAKRGKPVQLEEPQK